MTTTDKTNFIFHSKTRLLSAVACEFLGADQFDPHPQCSGIGIFVQLGPSPNPKPKPWFWTKANTKVTFNTHHPPPTHTNF